MQRLDAPVVAGQAGEACWVGAGGGEAGDTGDGDRGGGVACQVGDVAFDEGDVVDVGEREVLGCGEDLDGAVFDSSVAAVDRGVTD
jgi:hypothetical protein